MVLFSLPGFHEFYKMNQWILKLYKYNRKVFYPDVIIDNIYGSFPNIVWNGGRNSPIYNLDLDEVERICLNYQKYGVKLRFTFTNSMIDYNHLNDGYANDILSIINKYNFEITIYSDILENYIRQLFPNIALISSTTKCITQLHELNRELNKGYKLVVLDFRKNSDIDFLNRIRDKNKIEILVNEDCFCSCEQRKRHYMDISKNILSEDRMPDTEYYCVGKHKNFYDSFKQSTTLRVKDIYGFYNELGFTKMKLRGRRSDYFDVLESYIYYLIRSEYKDIIRLEMLKADLRENY